MKFSDLAGKRVGILGLGREGQAVWRQIRKRYPDQTISFFAESENDSSFIGQLDPGLDSCHFGPFMRDQLIPFDVLVRSAGISPYREVLIELRTLGVQFTTANSLWFAENPEAKTICITGTKGKSTTAALTAHLINCAGSRACLTGNIGRPMLDCDPAEVDWWVIELSSYQLSDLEAQPDIAVLLNISSEHIDWHGSIERYRADKLRLIGLVGDEGLIANHSDAVLVESLTRDPKHPKAAGSGSVIWFNGSSGWRADKDSVSYVPCAGAAPTMRIQAPASLPGEHNMQNLAAALTVLQSIGLQYPDMQAMDEQGIDRQGKDRQGKVRRGMDIEAALGSFTGLPHRLQRIGQVDGISYVDDSISTTPVSVTAALNTLDSSAVVLLLGGLDRGLVWDEFAAKLEAHMPHAIITMPDNGPVIFRAIEQAKSKPPAGLHAVENLQQAVALAQKLVPDNGCILLSPGAPSFPHFRDFEDRGNQFAQFAGVQGAGD